MHRPMTSGRNRAVLLGCRANDGATVECVVKLAACLGGFAPVPYLVEWFAAALGRLIGVDVAEPLEVLITEPFAASLAPAWRELARESQGSSFGSKLRLGPFTQWVPNALVPLDLRAAALELVAFDVFIHNPDRRVDNPNVLLSRQSVFAFDHGDAFSFLLPLLGSTADPAESPALDILERHVFARGLGKKIPSLDRFRSAVATITDEQLDAIDLLAPASWKVGLAVGKSGRIVDVIRRRRDAIATWLPQVEAWIQR